MRDLPNLRVILRWAFFGLGIFLIVRADLALNSALTIRPFAELLFPNDPRSQNIVTAVAVMVIIQAGLWCLATAWGLKRDRKWARWVGFVACVALLPGLPWFSIIGITGICIILVAPLKLGTSEQNQHIAPTVTQDYWTQARNSLTQRIILLLSGALLIAGLDGSSWLAVRLGLPEYSWGWRWWLYLVPLALANTAIHEFAHTFAAWAFHHRMRVISVGPLTWSKTTYGHSFQIQWNRLLETSGYMGSIPTSLQHMRLQQIAVVAAGPISSAFVGLIMLALFLGLPGTLWQQYWEVIALTGVIAFDYAVTSLIPLGYSDGSMLFHLIVGTHPGQLLLDASLVAQMDQDAEAYQEHADFTRNVDVRELMLRQCQRMGPGNSLTLALCHQKLGYAKLIYDDWPGAEQELRKCLEFEAEFAQTKALGVNAWTLLHVACVGRHEVGEALRLFPSVLELLGQRKRENQSVHLAVTHTMLAQLQERSGHFNEALAEARAGLSLLSKHRERLALRAMLHSVEAQSNLCLGETEAGLTAARAAASIVRSNEFPAGERNLAWNRIAELGDRMWRAGQPAIALELLREAIGNLESAKALNAAARQKIKVTSLLRQVGKEDEAITSLPREDNLPLVLRRYLLSERANLNLAQHRPENAIADCLELIEFWRTESGADAETAVAERLLACAYLEQGNGVEAEALASKAIPVLDPWQYYEAARCRITLALAHLRTAGVWTPDCIAKSVNQIQIDPLLRPPEKGRLLETEAVRLEHYGRSEDAKALRRFAAEQRQVGLSDSRMAVLSSA